MGQKDHKNVKKDGGFEKLTFLLTTVWRILWRHLFSSLCIRCHASHQSSCMRENCFPKIMWKFREGVFSPGKIQIVDLADYQAHYVSSTFYQSKPSIFSHLYFILSCYRIVGYLFVCNRGDIILHHRGLHTDLNQCNQGS